jgi:hypothetical protein
MKKQMFALTLAMAIAVASSTAKADTFGYTFTGNDGVVATGNLIGNSVPTGGYNITSGTIFMSGLADTNLDGTGVLVQNIGQVFKTGGGTNVDASGTDSLLFPFTDQLVDINGLFLFRMDSGEGAALGSLNAIWGNNQGGYGMFGGNWTLNDSGVLTATPEPRSLLLLGTGLLGLAGMARRRFTHV